MNIRILTVLISALLLLAPYKVTAQETPARPAQSNIDEEIRKLRELRDLYNEVLRLRAEYERREGGTPAPSVSPAPRASNSPAPSPTASPSGRRTDTTTRAAENSGESGTNNNRIATETSRPAFLRDSPFTRLLVGFEVAGANRASNSLTPYLDMFFSVPFLRRTECEEKENEQARTSCIADRTRRAERACDHYEDPQQKARCIYNQTRNQAINALLPRVSVWGNVRITSVPQQVSNPLVTFAGNFLNPISSGQVNELVQGVEFQAGLEVPIRFSMPFPSISPGVVQRATVSLIASAGASDPFRRRDTSQVFRVNDEARRIFDIPQGREFIAFVSTDRDRFFRQYYGGLRFRGYFFSENNSDLLQHFPSIFDVTVGQNETVTGGRLRGAVLRADGSFPIPFSSASYITVFGTAMLKMTRRVRETNPLILAAPNGFVAVPGDNVFIQPTPTADRDYYRVGIGINIGELIRRINEGRSQPAQQNISPQATPTPQTSPTPQRSPRE